MEGWNAEEWAGLVVLYYTVIVYVLCIPPRPNKRQAASDRPNRYSVYGYSLRAFRAPPRPFTLHIAHPAKAKSAALEIAKSAFSREARIQKADEEIHEFLKKADEEIPEFL